MKTKKLVIGMSLVMMIMCLLCFGVEAEQVGGDCSNDDEYSNVVWSYENGTLSIDGVGYMKYYKIGDLPPWYEYRESITDVVFGERIENIGSYAFIGCTNLKELFIPEEINMIGEGFLYESGVETVEFESGSRDLYLADKPFYGAGNLVRVTGLSERVYVVYSDAFENSALDVGEVTADWYYDNILLKVNTENLNSDTYNVLSGTKVIADGALSGNIKVNLPDSLEILGNCSSESDSITYSHLPSCLKRLPNSYKYSENVSNEKYLEKKAKEWLNLGNKIITLSNSTAQDIIYGKVSYQDVEELMEFYCTTDGWYFGYNKSSASGLLNSGGIYDCLSVYSEGIIGIRDFGIEEYFISAFSAELGIILPKSLKQMPALGPSNLLISPSESSPVFSITFLNPECEIFDCIETINPVYVICGYPNSTAEAYAEKYNRTFVDISNCKHEVTCQRGFWEQTCQYAGYTGDTYCQYCGEFISKGNYINETDHSFGEWEITQEGDCYQDGIRSRNCTECGFKETETYSFKGHNYYCKVTKAATCTEWGEAIYTCENCGGSYIGYLEKLEHINGNGDSKCDVCGYDVTENCSCNCHAGGIKAFFFKILNFFRKLFSKNKVCACGVQH